MKEKQVSWLDLLTIASGADMDDLPRSAGTLAIDRIVSETEAVTDEELFLEMGVFSIHSSGGAAVVTVDFPSDKTFVYRKAKRMCENWLNHLNDESSENNQLSLCIVPYALEGQLVVVYNQLIFVDGYESERNQHRLILTFDNNATTALETEDIDYNAIQLRITEELRAYEQQIDEQIAQLIEEEKNLKEEENIVAEEMKNKLNNPLEHNREIALEIFGSKNVQFKDEDSRVRFVEDDE